MIPWGREKIPWLSLSFAWPAEKGDSLKKGRGQTDGFHISSTMNEDLVGGDRGDLRLRK